MGANEGGELVPGRKKGLGDSGRGAVRRLPARLSDCVLSLLFCVAMCLGLVCLAPQPKLALWIRGVNQRRSQGAP